MKTVSDQAESDVSPVNQNINRIFSGIAERYDLFKTLLSGGKERIWKASLFQQFVPSLPQQWLDIATGTGDFFLLAPHDCRKMVGFDQNEKMLQIAKNRNTGKNIEWISGDLNDLPFDSNSFDLITVGYGLRYANTIEHFADRCFHLLRSGGKFFAFDVGLPAKVLRPPWFAYLFLACTLYGTVLNGKPTIYWHLWQSLRNFPGQMEVSMLFRKVGFSTVIYKNEMLGTMFGLYAEKSQ